MPDNAVQALGPLATRLKLAADPHTASAILRLLASDSSVHYELTFNQNTPSTLSRYWR